MALRVFRSNQIEQLFLALAQELAQGPSDPLAPQWLVTQNPGMNKWLELKLADHLGIWAGGKVLFPKRLVEQIVGVGEHYQVESMALALFSQLSHLEGDPEFVVLSNYLKTASTPLDRWHLARKLADVYDQYLVYRPDWIRGFERATPPADETPEARWQRLLWVKLVAQLGPDHLVCMADRFFSQLSKGIHPTHLPEQISVFGLATLPPLFIDIFSALGDFAKLDLYQLCPTNEYWADQLNKKALLKQENRAAELKENFDLLYYESGNRLLSFLGRMGQEFQFLLEQKANYQEGPELFVFPKANSLLGQLQQDIYQLTNPEVTPPLAWLETENSLEVHRCAGALREVQVIKNRILATLNEDPSLSPADVLVLVSDLKIYAPLVPAVFGREPKIPYSLADQNLEEEVPLVALILEILALPEHRWSLSEVLGWLAKGGVGRRFGLDDHDLERARDLCLRAGIRWSKNETHRAELGQPSERSHTWAWGLDRVVLGYAMDDEETWEGILPLRGVEGLDYNFLGPLMEVLGFVSRLLDQAAVPKSLADWAQVLGRWANDLVAEDRAYELGLWQGLMSQLNQLELADTHLDRRSLADLLGRIGGNSSAARGFLSHGVTVCGMLPMRSIPFKVICMLGLGEDQFPAQRRPVSFDLAATRPRLGDRSKKEDDKYLFLEALLATRQRLILTYPGLGQTSNQTSPPSVVLLELLDYISLRYKNANRKPVEFPIQSHPRLAQSLKSFDPNFPLLANYSPIDFNAAQSALGQLKVSSFFELPLSPPAPLQLNLADLIRFFRDPLAGFFRWGLGLTLEEPEAPLPDREPLELDPLEKHGLGDFILSTELGPEEIWARLEAEGKLPSGPAGRLWFDQAWRRYQPVLTAQAGYLAGQTVKPPVKGRITLGEVDLQGELGGLWDKGLVRASASKPHGGLLFKTWIEHLFVNALVGPTQTALFAAPEKGRRGIHLIASPDAKAILTDLTKLFLAGCRRPLPLFTKEAWVFAQSYLKNPEKVDFKWQGTHPPNTTPAYKKLYHNQDLLNDPLCQEVQEEFKALALRTFGPLLKAEGRR